MLFAKGLLVEGSGQDKTRLYSTSNVKTSALGGEEVSGGRHSGMGSEVVHRWMMYFLRLTLALNQA